MKILPRNRFQKGRIVIASPELVILGLDRIVVHQGVISGLATFALHADGEPYRGTLKFNLVPPPPPNVNGVVGLGGSILIQEIKPALREGSMEWEIKYANSMNLTEQTLTTICAMLLSKAMIFSGNSFLSGATA